MKNAHEKLKALKEKNYFIVHITSPINFSIYKVPNNVSLRHFIEVSGFNPSKCFGTKTKMTKDDAIRFLTGEQKIGERVLYAKEL